MTSISMERNGGAIDPSRFINGMRRGSIYDSAEDGAFAGDRDFPDEREEDSDSCSSTSIGRNSDLSSGNSSGGEEEEGSGETEVQSSYKGPLDSMDALEDVLPVRKGISKFYNGKSKSFTSLADACATSDVKEIAKPENPYTKKRKNLLAHSMLWDRNRNPLRNNSGMPKKLTNCSQSSVALGMMAMSRYESNNNSDDCNSLSSSPSCSRPPLHPHGKRTPCVVSSSPDSPPPLRSSPWRSFSLTDLQAVAAAAATCNNEEKLH